MTVIVGNVNNSDVCKIFTITEEADAPNFVEFDIPAKTPLTPGTPKWANYVKGTVANFKGLFQFISQYLKFVCTCFWYIVNISITFDTL